VDVRREPATVTVQARITDAGAGVTAASIWIQRGVISEFEVPMRLVSGTRRDGLWRGTWRVGTCQVEAGRRTVRVDARDAASNQTQVSDGAPEINVGNDDHTGPWITLSSAATDSASLVFSEDVHGVSSTSAVLRDPHAGPDDPAISGRWECADDVGVLADCLAGPLRSARFLADAPLPGSPSPYLVLVINPEHILDVTDGAGNPFLGRSQNIGIPPKG
jgi:hypothetical protein